MSDKVKTTGKDSVRYIIEIVKAVIIATVASLLCVLLAAFVIKFFNLSSTCVPIINQVIRSLCVLLGCVISLRIPGNGWLRGIITGLAYAAISFVIFSLIGGGFEFDLTLLNNTVNGVVTGFIGGVIAMLIRRN